MKDVKEVSINRQGGCGEGGLVSMERKRVRMTVPSALSFERGT